MIIDKSLDVLTKELLTYYQNKDFSKAQDLANLMIKKFPKNNLSWQILSFICLKQEKKPDNYIGRVTINRILGFASIDSWKRQTDGNWQVKLIQVDCKEKKRKF